MVTIPYTLGPADDWDPQGYEEEEEDMIAPGMHVLEEDEEEEDDELADADAGLINEPVLEDIEEEEEEIDEESSFKDLEKDALAELEELEGLVLQSERETLKLTDFTEEE